MGERDRLAGCSCVGDLSARRSGVKSHVGVAQARERTRVPRARRGRSNADDAARCCIEPAIDIQPCRGPARRVFGADDRLTVIGQAGFLGASYAACRISPQLKRQDWTDQGFSR